MIILMNNTAENQAAAQAIKREKGEMPCQQFAINVDFGKMPGNTLYIVDLSADGLFQQMSAKAFFKTLFQNAPENLKKEKIHIYLLVSDINHTSSHKSIFQTPPTLLMFSQKFHDTLLENNYNVSVSMCGDRNYATMLLAAPENQESAWRVFGIEAENKANYSNYAHYLNYFVDNKITPLWKGSDICNWLNDPQKLIENDDSWGSSP